MRSVGQDDAGELSRRGRAEDAPAKALTDESRQVARVIEMGVRQHDGVDRVGTHGKGLPISLPQLLQSLEQAAIDENSLASVLEKVFGSRDGARGTEKRQRHEGEVYTGLMSSLLTALSGEPSVLAVELRPPRAELDANAGRDAWIDTHHAVRGFVRQRTFVFLTDSAVGAREEHNLRHLVINLGADVPRDRVVPFITTKHSLDYCLAYAERAKHEGFQSLVILGGDRSVGPPRCVQHAWQLRKIIHDQVPGLSLGGWANPHADADVQASYLADEHFHADYFLTQVVSHHDGAAVDRLLTAMAKQGIRAPGMFGVFYYRSAKPKTLDLLRQFLPVPLAGITEDFASGASPEEVCAKTLRALRSAGIKHAYVSNLPVGRARQTLEKIVSLT
jgi:hypothetical protein